MPLRLSTYVSTAYELQVYIRWLSNRPTKPYSNPSEGRKALTAIIVRNRSSSTLRKVRQAVIVKLFEVCSSCSALDFVGSKGEGVVQSEVFSAPGTHKSTQTARIQERAGRIRLARRLQHTKEAAPRRCLPLQPMSAEFQGTAYDPLLAAAHTAGDADTTDATAVPDPAPAPACARLSFPRNIAAPVLTPTAHSIASLASVDDEVLSAMQDCARTAQLQRPIRDPRPIAATSALTTRVTRMLIRLQSLQPLLLLPLPLPHAARPSSSTAAPAVPMTVRDEGRTEIAVMRSSWFWVIGAGSLTMGHVASGSGSCPVARLPDRTGSPPVP